MYESRYEKNQSLYDALSKYVKGHDKAKKVLINLVNRSQLNYIQRWHRLVSEDARVGVTNCLLIGDSGTGKTLLVESLAKVMDFPLIKISAPELTHTSAAGDGIHVSKLRDKIRSYCRGLMLANPQKYWSLDATIDQLIIFVDEIDKLALKSGQDWNKGTQSNFLKMFENKDEFPNITWIFAGAFDGLDKHESKVKGIGFNHTTKDSLVKESDLAEKIVEYGLLPELVGRLQNIIRLDKLTEAMYREILVTSVFPKYTTLLNEYGIKELNLTEEEIKTVLQNAIKSGLGVRSLQSSVNQLVSEMEFNPDAYIDKEEELHETMIEDLKRISE